MNDATLSMITIDPLWSVNELLRLHPAAGSVLNEHGVDSCCGGGDSLEDAARAANLDPIVLIGALNAALQAGER